MCFTKSNLKIKIISSCQCFLLSKGKKIANKSKCCINSKQVLSQVGSLAEALSEGISLAWNSYIHTKLILEVVAELKILKYLGSWSSACIIVSFVLFKHRWICTIKYITLVAGVLHVLLWALYFSSMDEYVLPNKIFFILASKYFLSSLQDILQKYFFGKNVLR